MMVTAAGALIAILGYGVVVGIFGLYFAARERTARAASKRTRTELLRTLTETATLHGMLKTDEGEELEVYLQKAAKAR